MRKGCIVFTIVMVFGIAIAGFFGYRYLKESLDVGSDLQSYSSRDSALAHVATKTPAPAAGSHLTAAQVDSYIGALDSVNVGWKALAAAVDSLNINTDSGTFNYWASPKLLREVMRLPLVTRRAVIGYLNQKKISWEEYVWIKEHTVAASGLTRAEFDSALAASIASHLSKKATTKLDKSSKGDIDKFFARIESLRADGSIDSSDRALASPYRATLLQRALPSIIGVETSLDAPPDIDLGD